MGNGYAGPGSPRVTANSLDIEGLSERRSLAAVSKAETVNVTFNRTEDFIGSVRSVSISRADQARECLCAIVNPR
jgi:hypothetical protein